MSKRDRSESLFGETKQTPPPKMIRKINPEERAKEKEQIRSAAKNDYLFKKEWKDDLKKAFNKQVDSTKESPGIVQELELIQSSVHQKELSIITKANERRKRHYLLNGDICVYCHIINNWPRMVVRSLTVKLSEDKIPEIRDCKKENEFVLKAVFRPITVGIRRRIDPFIYNYDPNNSENVTINIDEYKRLAFICCFKEWNIPVEVEFDGDCISEKCWIELSKTMNPKLIDVVASEFLALNDVTEVEREILDQQTERLFSKNSKGVANPMEGIRLYCEANVFAKEFALSGQSLENLPYRVASMIRQISSKGSEIHSREMDKSSKSNKSAKVAGGRKIR